MAYVMLIIFLIASIWLFIDLMKEYSIWKMLILVITYNALFMILESDSFKSYHTEVEILRIISGFLIVGFIFAARNRKNKNKQIEDEKNN